MPDGISPHCFIDYKSNKSHWSNLSHWSTKKRVARLSHPP